MDTLYIIYFFIAGLFFGSFYGVVGSRLSEGGSIIKPRSHCSKCGHELKWYELIPVVSYLIQNGKCRSCKASFSAFYPITELICGLLFALSFFVFGFSRDLVVALLISSFLVIVIVSDITYLIIPDEVTIFFSIVTLFYKLIRYDFYKFIYSIVSGALLFLIMYGIMIVGNKIFKKETLGGADIKLMFYVGIILGPVLGMFNIFLSSCLALPVSLIFLLKNKNNVIPYGPFILMALYLIFCFI